jgi:hypothetical protein
MPFSSFKTLLSRKPGSATLLAGCLMLGLLATTAHADEGMWLFNRLPGELLQKRYGFAPDAKWVERIQKASVRFGRGGSASFISKDGLLISNHHVGAGTLQRLSSKENNLIYEGFYARTLAEEKPCPGVELWVLIEIEDVTARVNQAVKSGMSDEAAFEARRGVIAEIEKSCSQAENTRCDIVTLFQGAEYHLYKYRRYTDVRLVFAPEEQIAFFGGDPDNFEFPRYNLDICLFRAYENGKPAQIEHYLKWSASGPQENECVVVSGHPGRTDRLRTVAEVEYLRDYEYPRMLGRLKRLEVLLHAYSQKGEENARRARGDLRSIENGRKVRDGTLAGLLDPQLMERKRLNEQKLVAAVKQRPDLAEAAGAWERIAAAQKVIGQRAVEFELLESGTAFGTHLFTYARQLLRAAEESGKADGERLEEFRSASMPSVELAISTETPIYDDLEVLKLADSLTYFAEKMGAEHTLVKRVLNGKSPRDRASELVQGSRLKDVAFRRSLFADGGKAIQEAKEPLIELARSIDSEARAVRKIIEVQREAIRQSHAAIGKARYVLQGPGQYPDATGTLRLSFGATRGYMEDGKAIPFQTTYQGLYDRCEEHRNQPPFDLPGRWKTGQERIKLSVPYNFVSTADIIGGNSGSPVVNKAGEFVGIIFDGNIHSLVAGIAYDEEQSRAVAVHSAGIIEALQSVYNAGDLVKEIRSGQLP